MSLAVVILAAGLGTRMKSSTPKVLHKICERPIIQYVVDSIKPLKPGKIIVVVGPNSEGIKNALAGYSVVFAIQKNPLGTGNAFKVAAKELKRFKGTILVLSGDTPLISASTLQRLLDLHRQGGEDISINSFIGEGDHCYGRIIRNEGEVEAIIEDRDADEEQKKIKEVNGGIYAIKSHILNLLKEIKINKGKGEYYLVDIVGIAVNKSYRVAAHIIGSESELTGVNTRKDLYKVSRYLRDRVVERWLQDGVSFIDSASVFIHPEVKIGMDTVIYPNVYLEGETIIGDNCTIYPNTRIVSSEICNSVVIKDSTVIESSIIKDRAVIGPFAHIRAGSIIGSSSKIGNFVEIKKSVIGDGTKASHLSYLGDAEIGENVNIGAGSITCNYDGQEKHKTIIEEGAFIGSGTQLVAPVRVERGAYIGAGSTITEDVPSLSLAISRAEQRNVKNWAAKRRPKDKKGELRN
ncbi:bifunctional UDP-N-acetylglucosamine diphosphorylase/glucosamine-1-phosphate N-acetyltransferase GlmU [Thermodesulfovibrionales bacterium]|nr:bifunctional UDP-N-acetylglucosamine diphosphorylase/glucosamine-1-phosphate N-acetyltransferase GlmU [Thermodesulfovibrionales bacterium]